MGTRSADAADAADHAPLTRRRALAALAALALVAAAVPPARAVEPPPEPLSRFPTMRVEIDSGAHTHVFKAWVADTEPRRNRGLMFVKSLAADRGMLFLFEPPQVTAFWMKNTLIPLDLLFVGPDGRVIRLVENATPMSEATISSMGVVTAVLELAGGTASRLAIKPGDRLRASAADGR
ncbi:MAG: DUF192 domain-containing protein [Proteobacteria bacterium]|nr:DUF192 domain-containing protein [Pseudomonadota bacterium]